MIEILSAPVNPLCLGPVALDRVLRPDRESSGGRVSLPSYLPACMAPENWKAPEKWSGGSFPRFEEVESGSGRLCRHGLSISPNGQMAG